MNFKPLATLLLLCWLLQQPALAYHATADALDQQHQHYCSLCIQLDLQKKGSSYQPVQADIQTHAHIQPITRAWSLALIESSAFLVRAPPVS